MDPAVKALIDMIPFLRGEAVTGHALDGGMTNRNYFLRRGEDRFVLRIAGENSDLLGIDRRTEHACAQAAFGAGMGPEVVAFLPERGAMLTRFVPGEVLVPDAMRTPEILRRIVQSLRRYHECSDGAGEFSAFETVRIYYEQAKKRRVPFPRKMDSALEALARIEKAIGVPDRLCPCHNDLLPGNLVHHKRRIWILDWEYAGRGDLFFDLGNLAANNLFGEEQERTLLRDYFGRFHSRDLQRVRLMRLVSDMREAMWGFLQMGISQLDFDFRTYANRHLRRFLGAPGLPLSLARPERRRAPFIPPQSHGPKR